MDYIEFSLRYISMREGNVICLIYLIKFFSKLSTILSSQLLSFNVLTLHSFIYFNIYYVRSILSFLVFKEILCYCRILPAYDSNIYEYYDFKITVGYIFEASYSYKGKSSYKYSSFEHMAFNLFPISFSF